MNEWSERKWNTARRQRSVRNGNRHATAAAAAVDPAHKVYMYAAAAAAAAGLL